MQFRLTFYPASKPGTGNVLIEGTMDECAAYMSGVTSTIERDSKHDTKTFEYDNPIGMKYAHLTAALMLMDGASITGSYHIEPVF